MAHYTMSQSEDSNEEMNSQNYIAHIPKIWLDHCFENSFQKYAYFQRWFVFKSKNDHLKQAQWPETFDGRKCHCKITAHWSGDAQAHLPDVPNP